VWGSAPCNFIHHFDQTIQHFSQKSSWTTDIISSGHNSRHVVEKGVWGMEHGAGSDVALTISEARTKYESAFLVEMFSSHVD
jgi:hypothetical protein